MATIKTGSWKVTFDERARRELRKLDADVQDKILRYFRKRIVNSDDPRKCGKALAGELSGLWRYRIGDYRAICSIHEKDVLVLVLRIGHRREIYR